MAWLLPLKTENYSLKIETNDKSKYNIILNQDFPKKASYGNWWMLIYKFQISDLYFEKNWNFEKIWKTNVTSWYRLLR